MQTNSIPILEIALLCGIVAVYIYLSYRHRKKLDSIKQELENERLEAQTLRANEKHHIDKIESMQQEIERLKLEYEEKILKKDSILQEINNAYMEKISELEKSHKAELDNRIKSELAMQEEKLLAQNRERQEEIAKTLSLEREKQEALLTQKFQEISDTLLEQKGKQFQEKQESSLKPLTDEIMRFKQEIAQNTKENQEKQTSLITEIKLLKEANALISKEANNLANVMSGGGKQQGQWGELVLERILEGSGLENGREYHLQQNLKDDSNNNLRPDALIHLPNNRMVVVDSKVSLNAFLAYSNADNKETKERHLKAHIESIKTHVKALSSKSYQDYTKGDKLDFVIMFLPSEGAYNEILKEDMKIFMESYQKGIIISSPTNLMVILRLIHYLWKNEARDKNIDKILDSCTKLIKKFEGFKDSMQKIDKAIEQAKNAYQKADTQLSGKGSIVSYMDNLDKYMSKILDSNLEDKHRKDSIPFDDQLLSLPKSFSHELDKGSLDGVKVDSLDSKDYIA